MQWKPKNLIKFSKFSLVNLNDLSNLKNPCRKKKVSGEKSKEVWQLQEDKIDKGQNTCLMLEAIFW